MKKYIYSAKKTNLSLDNFDFSRFSPYQTDEIREGLEEGLDVSVYADPKFRWNQMAEIRRGLESGVDVSVYADPKFHWAQMYQIRKGLESGVDVSVYADPKFDDRQMERAQEGLMSGRSLAEIARELSRSMPVKPAKNPQKANSFTDRELINMLNDAGIDTTKCNYELKAEEFNMFGDDEEYTRKFTCPGDWLAYFSMILHKQPTAAAIDNYFGREQFEEIIDNYPTIDDIADLAWVEWGSDRGDDSIIYLKNLTTGQEL